MSADVAIIGGGISGLAAAWELARRGHQVVVLERQVRIGGNALSERIDGFLMEHGPSSLNGSSRLAQDWSRELGLERQRVGLGGGVRRRYLVGDGVLQGIATHPLGFLTSGYLSAGARLRLLGEVAVGRKRDGEEESVAAFCRRRFGSTFADRVIDPLVGGMFAARPAELSMAAVFPRLVEMERRYGSVIGGMMFARLRGGRMPARELFSWRDGVGALPRGLAARLGPAIRTGVAVRRIVAVPGGYRVEMGARGALVARAVVIATQPHVAAALLERVDPEGAAAADSIAAAPLAVVFLGYRRAQVAHPLDGLGYLAPGREGRPLSGTLFASTMFAGRAPRGHVALAGYVGGARAPELAGLPADALVDIARGELSDLLGARGEPVVSRVRQWPRGLPQYRLGHQKLTGALTSSARRRPGLFATGNYLSGVSIAACLTQAAETAARVHAFLDTRTSKGGAARTAGSSAAPARIELARER